MTNLGLRVVELREGSGLTQEQLAERLAFSVRYVQRLEAGKANVAIAMLPDLSDALGCSVQELFAPAKRRVTRRAGRPAKS